MGIDCSNCRCANRDEEKILIIEHSVGMNKYDSRKDNLEKSKGTSKFLNIQELINRNPSMVKSIIKIQSLIKQYRHRKVYKAILKKFRQSQNYFTHEEEMETLSNERFLCQLEQREGSYTYKSNGIYSGQWLGGFRHGRGIMRWSDGTYYEGQWSLGYAEGTGDLRYHNGDYMKGQFMYNKLNGYGECLNNELGYEYKGYWENDLQTGEGRECWPDGSEYLGLYELGKKDGFGRYQWTDGSNYIGEWKDNKIQGLGIYYWSDGRKYAGEWKNSKMNGFGLFLWKDGRTYKGEYKEDKKHHFGIYYGNLGKKYEGFWECGSQKHLGKYTKKDGSFKIGLWDENQMSTPITNEEEIANKLREIDTLAEETINKVAIVLQTLKLMFSNAMPSVPFESLLGFP